MGFNLSAGHVLIISQACSSSPVPGLLEAQTRLSSQIMRRNLGCPRRHPSYILSERIFLGISVGSIPPTCLPSLTGCAYSAFINAYLEYLSNVNVLIISEQYCLNKSSYLKK